MSEANSLRGGVCCGALSASVVHLVAQIQVLLFGPYKTGRTPVYWGSWLQGVGYSTHLYFMLCLQGKTV